jgi:hypothetical protein
MSKQDIAKLRNDLQNEKPDPRKKAISRIKKMNAQEALPILAGL